MPLSISELSNGLDPELDYMLPERPADPEMRESASIWMYEENGAFGFPRFGLEATGADWDARPFQANIAFPSGRILSCGGVGAPPSPIGPDGRATILGAGPLTFECVEPLKRWSVTLDGPAVDGDVSEQIAGTLDRSRTTHVRVEADLTMATPAWHHVIEENDSRAEAEFMGLGWRYEHLFRAKGSFTVDGRTTEFNGVGSHIRRRSIRRLEGFYGHVWQSALFPDGRAFAINVFPDRDDRPQYNTGYIYQDGRMIDARVIRAPWLGDLIGEGEDVSLELESELGRTRIEGVTLFSTFILGSPMMQGLRLYQGGARYTWDGQSAIGMIERSS